MMKPLITLGDKTSHGGVVISADTGFLHEGQPVACDGDQVTCPIKGHGPARIIASGQGFSVNGKQAAHDGDKTTCGATLIASHHIVRHK
ncbi:PAAR domain-containing protein [Salmonella enterica]|uniref:PAAR domain-containing protein n=1 Tax=Salmonella enterica TaxID=28901 RepID=A0A3J8WSF2_SALER|nr:PAAR domain-containing protein [Salmonella enterica]EAU5130894.1 PAAR domain-containing protein [Salmonella enterica subsp. enterica serovar Oranienburg]ECD9477136.1 PAAR domain-containing protein [Salmonella enterica subsp. houtenae]EAO3204393.1 PAAR domain-containing protein [Salmonella enterica]EAX0785460.1 PAAR domain-containing protein [Salmonella enterica]